MLPPAWFLLTLVATAALHWLLPGFRLLSPPVSYLGLVLIAVGLLFLIQPARIFDRVKTPIHPRAQPTTFVTHGWYRISRNPMYLGMILGALGFAVILGSATPFLAPLGLFLLLDRRFVRPEEVNLRAAFGTEYIDCCRRVRRWV